TGECLDRGVKVVSNAGGLDPDRCAEAVAEMADKLGLAPTIAYVTGDNILDRLDELAAAGLPILDFETGEPVAAVNDKNGFISANAYLGCWGIVEALAQGADIVVTGRTTDAAIVCGPAANHHGWDRTDWNALAGAVVAGHVIECGTQTTGGNYSFFTELDGMDNPGFPIAEIAADGSSVITKHPGTGGGVTVGTVTAQLLYEIGGPSYLGPDVAARFDTITLAEEAPDRVTITGVQGEPPPPTLKVSMNSWGGYRSDLRVALVGLDIEAKAALAESVLWRSTPFGPDDFDAVSISVDRTDKVDPASNTEATATWRATLKDRDERKVRSVGSAMNNMALASIPGFHGLPGTQIAQPFGVHTSGLIASNLVPQQVTILGGSTTVVESAINPGDTSGLAVEPLLPELPDPVGGPTVQAPLGTIIGARSGDKGGNANLGLFARTPAAAAWLAAELTTDRLRELLPETAGLEIERFEFPNIWSVNFVIHGILQEGVAASTRLDGQAKSLGEWVRARVVDIPSALLPDGTAS
ncbi:MAG: DUF1446 domain-containing protein, partial [Acidimicrobiia bacterium]|nr:DUF1446 domain-containing protein [Acidimicrobiia bacterium]